MARQTDQQRAYEKTPTRKASKYYRQYGITLEQREQVYETQGRCCAICKKHCESKSLLTDHDHATGRGVSAYGGRFRGLLCSRCNSGFGFFADDPQRLAAAMAYLTAPSWNFRNVPEIRSEYPKFYDALLACRKCGTTKRYKSNRNCVECHTVKKFRS